VGQTELDLRLETALLLEEPARLHHPADHAPRISGRFIRCRGHLSRGRRGSRQPVANPAAVGGTAGSVPRQEPDAVPSNATERRSAMVNEIAAALGKVT